MDKVLAFDHEAGRWTVSYRFSVSIVAILAYASGVDASPSGQEASVTTPESDAQEVLGGALDRAKEQGKRVFLQVGGEGCSWCVRLDALLSRDEVAQVMGLDYVIAKINLDLDRGAVEVVRRFAPDGVQGIPWYAILDADGRAIVSSDGPNGNIGYPLNPDGIGHFMSMIERTSRTADEDDRDRLEAALEEQAEAILGPRTDPVISADGLTELEGRWTLVRMEFHGQVQDATRSSRSIEVEGDRLVHLIAEEEQSEAKISNLVPSTTPAQIDLTRLRDNQTILGIYMLDGPRLTICTSHFGTRPTTFEATKDNGFLISVYERTDPAGNP